MRNKIALFLFMFLPVFASAQFFYSASRTSPDTKYKALQTSGTQVITGADLSKGNSFSIAAWVGFSSTYCSGNIIANADFRIYFINATNERKRVRVSFKDSLIVEGSTINNAISERLNIGGVLNHHIVVTYDGSNTVAGIQIYLDGLDVNEDVLTNLPLSGDLSANKLTVGNAACPNTYYYQVDYYSSALSLASVRDLYNTPLSQIGTPSLSMGTTNTYRKNGFYETLFGKTYRMGSAPARIFDIGVWGDKKGFGVNNYGSPLESQVSRPQMYYHPAENITYIGTQARGGPGYRRDSYILQFDHSKRTLRTITKAQAKSWDARDNHQTPAVILGRDSSIVVALEDKHSSPMQLHKELLSVSSDLTKVGQVGSNVAYPQMFYLGDTLWLVGRNGSIHENQIMYYSLDDGTSWSSGTVYASVQNNDWLYGSTLTASDTVAYYLLFNRRQSTDGQFKAIYLLRSTDGINFCNIDETYCKNVFSGSEWLPNELSTYALVDSVSTVDETTITSHALIDTAGDFSCLIANDEVGGYMRGKYDRSIGWVFDTLNIGTAGFRTADFAMHVYKGDGAYDIFSTEDRGGYRVVVRFETTDEFDTLTEIGVVSESNRDYFIGTTTHNPTVGNPVIIGYNVELNSQTERSGMWLYEYNPWLE